MPDPKSISPKLADTLRHAFETQDFKLATQAALEAYQIDEAIANKKINHRIPLPEFGSANFLRSLKAQIHAHYPGAKVKAGSLAGKI